MKRFVGVADGTRSVLFGTPKLRDQVRVLRIYFSVQESNRVEIFDEGIRFLLVG